MSLFNSSQSNYTNERKIINQFPDHATKFVSYLIDTEANFLKKDIIFPKIGETFEEVIIYDSQQVIYIIPKDSKECFALKEFLDKLSQSLHIGLFLDIFYDNQKIQIQYNHLLMHSFICSSYLKKNNCIIT